MPDLQPSTPSPTPLPGLEATSIADEDFGYALGCECADPALQIERWQQEARSEAN